MAVKTTSIYSCDGCGKTFRSQKDVVRVTVDIGRKDRWSKRPDGRGDLCVKCLADVTTVLVDAGILKAKVES